VTTSKKVEKAAKSNFRARVVEFSEHKSAMVRIGDTRGSVSGNGVPTGKVKDSQQKKKVLEKKLSGPVDMGKNGNTQEKERDLDGLFSRTGQVSMVFK